MYKERMDEAIMEVDDARARLSKQLTQLQVALNQALTSPLAHEDISTIANRFTVSYTTAPLPDSLRGA